MEKSSFYLTHQTQPQPMIRQGKARGRLLCQPALKMMLYLIFLSETNNLSPQRGQTLTLDPFHLRLLCTELIISGYLGNTKIPTAY